MRDETTFTHLIIKKATRRKISILATVLDQRIYNLVDYWVGVEWKSAIKAGLVKESMLEAGEKEGAKS